MALLRPLVLDHHWASRLGIPSADLVLQLRTQWHAASGAARRQSSAKVCAVGYVIWRGLELPSSRRSAHSRGAAGRTAGAGRSARTSPHCHIYAACMDMPRVASRPAHHLQHRLACRRLLVQICQNGVQITTSTPPRPIIVKGPAAYQHMCLYMVTWVRGVVRAAST